VALSYYHQAHQGADVAGLLVHLLWPDVLADSRAFSPTPRATSKAFWKTTSNTPSSTIFTPPHVQKSLPRMLFLVLESCAVTRACLDIQVYEENLSAPGAANTGGNRELELAGFAFYLGYDWEEVTGDGDLRLAVE